MAAANTGRHFIGYDTDTNYVRQARERVASLPLTDQVERRTLKDLAKALLDLAGYSDVAENVKVSAGVSLSFAATLFSASASFGFLSRISLRTTGARRCSPWRCPSRWRWW